ncbi:hypothetical protein M2197_006451 [Bradyrhizobium japonicum]|nr:hypothetical protein [Bradyrhizobium japonicum]BAL10557.1 hypothetical protein BJ6T_52970 [Bradyrhizobium japonicum USDA 6]MCS3992798.1 hypothetical protein [Bradyrhizobium japonicum]MCS4021270.1 hypothetical protein [Bradyrhizobium japonicum]MCS4208379.1 hypothetical protein [Bradyrhizobium japonicum]
MRWFCLSLALLPAGAVAQQQPKGDVFPPVVNGIEYRLKYGQHPREGWQDGMRFDFSREECRRRLQGAPEPSVCMIRPEPTAL